MEDIASGSCIDRGDDRYSMGGRGGSALIAERMTARAAARAEGGSGRATLLWPTGMTGKVVLGLRSVSMAKYSSSVQS